MLDRTETSALSSGRRKIQKHAVEMFALLEVRYDVTSILKSG